MPDLKIVIGGRDFQVACQPGEEHFLRGAAQMLDNEAQPLVAQLGRLPETRLLLMAGLMLADKTAALEDELRSLKAQVADAQGASRTPVTVEVPVIPAQVTDLLVEIAARTEAMAARIDGRAS